MVEDFDILYPMKTPFFMGDSKEVLVNAAQCDISPEDEDNMTKKNLLLVRALAQSHDMNGLAQMFEGLKNSESAKQKQNCMGFTILAQYLVQNKID